MPRALVTGGAGFLGSHLCDYLLAQGFEVVVFDNLITGSTDNIAHLIDNPKFRFVHYDVTEYLYLDGPIDYIFHLASPASPIDFETKPIQIMKVNALGTHKALGLARAKNATFFFASTSEVYGDPLVHGNDDMPWRGSPQSVLIHHTLRGFLSGSHCPSTLRPVDGLGDLRIPRR